MELPSHDRETHVADGHDRSVFEPSAHAKFRRQRLGLNDQRVIPSYQQRTGEPCELALPIMPHERSFSVHGVGCLGDPCTKGLGNDLMTQTHAEDGDLIQNAAHKLHGSSVPGRARARGEDHKVKVPADRVSVWK